MKSIEIHLEKSNILLILYVEFFDHLIQVMNKFK
jgi:hypothetical protein